VQLPKQQKNTTYEAGTVLKLKNVTFDADYYHIHFDNSYACVTTTSSGDDNACSVQPSSITQGIEGESNLYLTHGLSVYLNASYDKAVYQGTLTVPCVAGAGCTASTPQLTVTAPSGLNVAQTPSDLEAEGLTYQHKALDIGFFNKRVGTQYIDNGNVTNYTYHNQGVIAPFDFANLFFNYTIRGGGRFDQTKVRLSFNNLFNSSAITGNTFASGTNPLTQTIAANGTTYTDPFNTTGLTPIAGGDNVSVMAGRSVSLSVIFGFAPKR
jgi:iron complex outermembrane receptor protein